MRNMRDDPPTLVLLCIAALVAVYLTGKSSAYGKAIGLWMHGCTSRNGEVSKNKIVP